jgi:hypothetical protein
MLVPSFFRAEFLEFEYYVEPYILPIIDANAIVLNVVLKATKCCVMFSPE